MDETRATASKPRLRSRRRMTYGARASLKRDRLLLGTVAPRFSGRKPISHLESGLGNPSRGQTHVERWEAAVGNVLCLETTQVSGGFPPAVLITDACLLPEGHDGLCEPVRVHDAADCEGCPCCIHHPSNHHMASWPQVWRSDRYMMERTCSHGIGHPDPDHMAYVLTKPGRVGERESGVHGCDGCCVRPEAN